MFSKIGWSTRRAFYEQAQSQLDNGLALTKVIENFALRLERQHRTRVSDTFNSFGRRVRDGGMLTDAMKEYLTDIEIGLLSAGEKTGQIGLTMRFVVETKDRESRIMKKIRGAMLAPAVYMAAGFGTLYMIGTSIVPQFSQVVPPDKWSGSAYAMKVMGDFAMGWGLPISLTIFVLALVALWWSFARWSSDVRDVLDKNVFPYTTYKEMQGITWLIAFLSLVRSGVVDVSAIDGQIKSANPWLTQRLIPVRDGLRNGQNLFDALNSTGVNFPSADLVEEIGAYVEFPNFTDKLERIVAVHVERFESRIGKIGMFVGAIFTSVMYGMFLLIQLGANDLSNIVSSSVTH